MTTGAQTWPKTQMSCPWQQSNSQSNPTQDQTTKIYGKCVETGFRPQENQLEGPTTAVPAPTAPAPAASLCNDNDQLIDVHSAVPAEQHRCCRQGVALVECCSHIYHVPQFHMQSTRILFVLYFVLILGVSPFTSFQV